MQVILGDLHAVPDLGGTKGLCLMGNRHVGAPPQTTGRAASMPTQTEIPGQLCLEICVLPASPCKPGRAAVWAQVVVRKAARNAGTKDDSLMFYVQRGGWFTHHQKSVIMDAPQVQSAPSGDKGSLRFIGFMGGLDLCDGRHVPLYLPSLSDLLGADAWVHRLARPPPPISGPRLPRRCVRAGQVPLLAVPAAACTLSAAHMTSPCAKPSERASLGISVESIHACSPAFPSRCLARQQQACSQMQSPAGLRCSSLQV